MRTHQPTARLVLGLLLLAGLGCGHAHNTPAEKPPPAPLSSKLVVVDQIEWPSIVRVQGNLLADEHSTLSARVAGLVETIQVERGQVVNKGDVLVQLRQRDFDLKVNQAEAQLKQTRSRLGLTDSQKDSDLDPEKAPPVREAVAAYTEALTKHARGNTLHRTGAISSEEFQTLSAAVEVAKARSQSAQNQVRELLATLALARAELGLAEQARADAVIRAPFDGIVESKIATPGAYVVAGSPLVALVRTNPLRFTAGVPERRALDVEPGQAVVLMLEGRKQPLGGKVTRIGPALAMNSRALTVEVDIPNEGHKIPANFFAEADILVDPDAKTLAIPVASLGEFAGVEKVWRVREGEAAEVRVRTGRRNFQHVEILEGLQAGDTILVDARLGRAGPVTVQGTIKNPPVDPPVRRPKP